MSSGNFTDAEVFAIVAQGTNQDYSGIACAALLLYDHVLTFSQEVNLIWSRKLTGPSVLFTLNRFTAMVIVLGEILFVPNWTTFSSCKASAILYYTSFIMIYIVWGAFSTLRVYAVAGRAWLPAILTLFLCLFPVVVELYQTPLMQNSLSVLSPTLTLCTSGVPWSQTAVNGVLIGIRTSAIAADAFVIAVTWWKTYSIKAAAGRVGMDAHLASRLIKDGTVYFGGLLALNIAQLIIDVRNAPFVLDNLVQSLCCIIISRFILSLREIADKDMNRSATALADSSAFTSLNFRIVGNMGEDLQGSFGGGNRGDEPEDEADTGSDTIGVSEETGIPASMSERADVNEISRV